MLKRIEGRNKFNNLHKVKQINDSIIKVRDSFEVLEDSVESFLNKKRDYWPRLYLLTNYEMLCLLSTLPSTISSVINQYADKLFNVRIIDISEDEDCRIRGFYGSKGEFLPFRNMLLTTRSSIEVMLEGISKAMQVSVYKSMIEAYAGLAVEGAPKLGTQTQTNGT